MFERQVNCMSEPERSIVNLLSLAGATVPAWTIPSSVYDAFWSTATWGEGIRRVELEAAFTLILTTIDDVGFVTCLNTAWMSAYRWSVLNGETSITAECPCNRF